GVWSLHVTNRGLARDDVSRSTETTTLTNQIFNGYSFHAYASAKGKLVLDRVRYAGTNEVLVRYGHDRLIGKKRTQGFAEGACSVGVSRIRHVQRIHIQARVARDFVKAVEFQDDACASITQLNRLVDRAQLRSLS